MSKAKAILLLLAFVLVAGGAILLVMTSPRELISSPKTQARRVGLRGYDEEGALVWSLEALEGEMKDDTGTLNDVEVLFSEGGSERLRATADTLTFAGKEATLSGRVAVHHDDYRLQTETLDWLESERVLTAGATTIFFEQATLEAGAFQYDMEQERAILEEGVVATVTQARTLQVVGDRAEETRGRVILTGGVSVNGEDESFRCAGLEFDREGEDVTLFGGVEGRFNMGTIHADSVALDSEGMAARGKVTLLLDPPFFRQADDA